MVDMVQQGNSLSNWLKLGKNLKERRSCDDLIAICPACGTSFDVDKNHYNTMMSTFCPNCGKYIGYDK